MSPILFIYYIICVCCYLYIVRRTRNQALKCFICWFLIVIKVKLLFYSICVNDVLLCFKIMIYAFRLGVKMTTCI